MKYIYITRHGKTVWNEQGRLQGQKDSPLIEEGIEQAKKLNKILDHIDIDIAYTSPLKRTIDTTNILVGEKNIPIIKDERIIEMSLGDWEGLTKKEIREINKEEDFIFKKSSHKFQIDGMENFFDVRKRTENFIAEIMKIDFKKALVVCHAITLRSILMIWDGRSMEGFWEGMKTPPGCLAIICCPTDNYKNGEIVLPPTLTYI